MNPHAQLWHIQLRRVHAPESRTHVEPHQIKSDTVGSADLLQVQRRAQKRVSLMTPSSVKFLVSQHTLLDPASSSGWQRSVSRSNMSVTQSVPRLSSQQRRALPSLVGRVLVVLWVLTKMIRRGCLYDCTTTLRLYDDYSPDTLSPDSIQSCTSIKIKGRPAAALQWTLHYTDAAAAADCCSNYSHHAIIITVSTTCSSNSRSPYHDGSSSSLVSSGLVSPTRQG
jgi:hypothetical protein